jgi:hypothetical protein
VHTRLAGGWKALPPANEAPNVFVFVHGYNVPLDAALDRWFPLVFKRLYWAGVPLIRGQRTTPQREVQMVGFTWPGNQGRIFPTDTSPYPPNEFNAMQSAVPLALFLGRREGGVGGRNVQVMAHSLGNMVVNEALTMLPPFTVRRYIMNDAAVSTEAFADAPYVQDALELSRLAPHSVEWGYPLDTRAAPSQGALPPVKGNWEQQWKDMLADAHRPSRCGVPDGQDPPPGTKPDLDRWRQELRDLETSNPTVRAPQYNVRWRQFAHRSAWTGVYKDVPLRTELINTYNPNDSVITLRPVEILPSAWLFVQQAQKPFTGFLGLGADDQCVLFWAQLQDLDRVQQDEVWAAGRVAGELLADKSPNGIGLLTRRWGERAYWFASRSGAVGAQPLAPRANVQDRSFEAEGGTFHSYLYRERPLPALWESYGYLARMIESPDGE